MSKALKKVMEGVTILKKLLLLFTALILVVSSLSLVGCGGGEKETDIQPTGSQKSSNDTAKSTKEVSIADLIAKGKKVESMNYDFVITSKDSSMNGKTWVQGNKVKTEVVTEGQKMITIFDGDTIYTYSPEQNLAYKLSPDKSNKTETPNDYTEDLDSESDKIKILETTVYDGVKCKVVEVISAESKEQMKMWLREDYGIPMRVESTESNGSKTVMEYKNLNVEPQPDETFKLPDGVQITDMNQMMKQMPVGQQ